MNAKRSAVGNTARDIATIFLRLALGVSFLSAVADRFGWWGAPGQPNVAWGDFSRFTVYTGTLNAWAPAALYPTLAWAATCAETVLGFALVLGLFIRVSAAFSGFLLLLFALTMTLAVSIKAPLDASVYSASAGAFLLSTCPRFPFSVDGWRLRRIENTRRPEMLR